MCDRYIDSTVAYQHYNGNIKLDVINYMQKLIDPKNKPDLTILLDIDPVVSKSRILKRSKKLDRFDKESVGKMNKIRKAFLKIAKLNKKRVIVISNNLSKKDVQTNVQNQVLKFINR